MVKRDTSKLSRRDKLELVLSEAPELPPLLGEVREHMSTLTNKVQPLVSNVTRALGASEDGLEYLHTRQQLLLAYCMNVCFYMVLKVRGETRPVHVKGTRCAHDAFGRDGYSRAPQSCPEASSTSRRTWISQRRISSPLDSYLAWKGTERDLNARTNARGKERTPILILCTHNFPSSPYLS